MDNVQNCDSYIKYDRSQAYRSYYIIGVECVQGDYPIQEPVLNHGRIVTTLASFKEIRSVSSQRAFTISFVLCW
jgi:hypothetical protein